MLDGRFHSHFHTVCRSTSHPGRHALPHTTAKRAGFRGVRGAGQCRDSSGDSLLSEECLWVSFLKLIILLKLIHVYTYMYRTQERWFDSACFYKVRRIGPLWMFDVSKVQNRSPYLAFCQSLFWVINFLWVWWKLMVFCVFQLRTMEISQLHCRNGTHTWIFMNWSFFLTLKTTVWIILTMITIC